MKEELITIAHMLMKMASRNERDVISQYISALNKERFDTARIISDELVDHFTEKNFSKKKTNLSIMLYDKTMQFYEINTK